VIPRRAQLVAALAAVHDPELDEPITTLGFVASLSVSDGGDVDVHLRLPTPQCAPNFAFLMVSDARVALRAVPGVGAVSVILDDHYTGAEINGAADFASAFPGETTGGDLEALRALFQRKALLARQGRVCAALLDEGRSPQAVVARRGLSPQAVVALRIVDIRGLSPQAETASEFARCLVLRQALGLPHSPDDPALIAGDGSALDAAGLTTWLRRARLVSLSLESNGGICRSLLRVRHGVPDPTEEMSAA
jgi:metal-sulfur cluster biosynthetic enzyme